MIRRIEEPDVKRTIARKVLEALHDWFEVDESREKYIAKSADQIFLGAEEDGEYVGFLCLKETGKETVELAVMGVMKEYHRKGLGRQLFEEAKKIAREEDLDWTLEADKEKRVKSLSDKQIELYGRLIEKIVIGAAKECGLDKNAIVCEDLGTLTNPVDAVMKKYGLQGMRLTQFVVPEKPAHPYRCKNITENVWNMVGTHDNNPIATWAESMINTHEGYLHAKNLVEDLFADADNKDDIIVRLTQDKDYLTFIKLVEIFASKARNVQIFFTDFFQIKETYNTPGTSGDQNWSLRLPNNFEDLNAIDLLAILKQAIISRGSDFAEKHSKLISKLA